MSEQQKKKKMKKQQKKKKKYLDINFSNTDSVNLYMYECVYNVLFIIF